MTSASVFRPLVLGVVTGLRSQLGLAVLAWSEPASKQDTRALRLLRSAPGRGLAGVGAAGELVADKLPSTPSRLEPRGLAFRLLAGAGVGALAVNSTDRRTVGVASAVGLAGAAVGTYAGAYYRKILPARTNTPDLPWAVGEDAVAAGLAATAVKVWPEPRPWWQRAPRAVARGSRAIARAPRAVADASRAVADASRAVAAAPRAVADASRAVAAVPRAVARAPRAVAGAPKAAVQAVPRAVARAPRAVAGTVTSRRR
ncbi:MAG TPA: hypothetical protein VH573_05925 [Mycobacteriales bacterium]|jgi:uncharacterized membrane protein